MTQDRAQLLITAVDQTRSAFDSIRGNLAKLGDESNRVKGMLAGLGVSLSVAGFAAMIKSAIDAADQLNKLSQKIGISVEALSTLRFAAQLSDVSLETLQKGIKGLSQNITEANTGIGDGAQVFDALGISVKNADGSMKSTEAVLLQMADVFANLEDGAVKTALAVKLFGKSGMDMIPFLNQGAAGINQLTAEAERLGLKLTTETARSAEAFNDNLTALKASSSSLGIALARDFLPELTNITNAMREAANEAGTLKALWVGLGGVGNLIFNGTEIKRARDEVARIQELVDSTRKKVDTGKAPVPFMPFDVKFNDGAMATLRKNLAQWEQELAGAKQRLDDLTSPKRPEEKTPTGKPTEDMQRIACVVSGGQWVNGKCEKKAAGGTEKDTTGAQLAVVKAQAESEFKVLKEGLDLQKTALDRALDDRLVSIRDYYARKTQIEQQAIDQELTAKQQELSAQSAVAVVGKDEAQRLRAKAEVKKLEGEITVLNMKRGEVEVANAHAAAKAEKELADELARVRAANPLVHLLTNEVVQEISANVLLAAGASPAMIVAEQEVGAFAAISGALLINVGTLYPERLAAMKQAVAAANRPQRFRRHSPSTFPDTDRRPAALWIRAELARGLCRRQAGGCADVDHGSAVGAALSGLYDAAPGFPACRAAIHDRDTGRAAPAPSAVRHHQPRPFRLCRSRGQADHLARAGRSAYRARELGRAASGDGPPAWRRAPARL